MNNVGRHIRKIKVLGYPHAKVQSKQGVELTPRWLQSQVWFQNMTSGSKSLVEYEEISVANSYACSNVHEDIFNSSSSDGEEVVSDDEAKNAASLMENADILRQQTLSAIKNGFYPIVLGGDQSQAIGSISGIT